MQRWSYLTVLWVGLAGVLTGCTVDHDLYTCLNPDPGHVDGQGKDDPCHTRPTCPGQCVAGAPPDWFGPVVAWIGPTSEVSAVQCPPEAPTAGPMRFADLVAPNECSACSCEPPTGSCELPTSIYARASICQKSGAWVTSFDAPANWDGSCTDINAIPQGTDCGGVPCVQSINIAPLKVIESGCTPVEIPPPLPPAPPSWGRAALLCSADLRPEQTDCKDSGLSCSPRADPLPAGFRHCVFKDNIHTCPPDYPQRYIFYEHFEDARSCSSCQCGEPIGSVCSASMSIFTAASDCTGPTEVKLISSIMPVCTDMAMPGQGALSKSATEPVYTPGICEASGGEPLGAAVPIVPSTICCPQEP
uniref:Uncharacterized protein n=1 Tax=Racemicystis crocea TaxID=1707966 RepID=A0A3S5GYP2_9BACT|nr:hypothetical protein [Racemicystis crocea]